MTTVRKWNDISWDPNAPAVVAWREQMLARTRQAPVPNRVAYLRGLAAGRKVLDIGVVEHDISNEQSDRWLHRHLVEASAECLGVDVLAEGIDALRAKGYNVLLRDVTSEPLEERFDLIVAGELIEHIGSPQGLLDAASQMLAEDGRLVLTTPNPYMIHRTWKSLRGRFADSVDHLTLLGPSNLAEMGSRAGLDLLAWRGISVKDLPGVKNRVASLTRKALIATAFAPEIACDSLIYEFGLADESRDQRR